MAFPCLSDYPKDERHLSALMSFWQWLQNAPHKANNAARLRLMNGEHNYGGASYETCFERLLRGVIKHLRWTHALVQGESSRLRLVGSLLEKLVDRVSTPGRISDGLQIPLGHNTERKTYE